MNGDFALGNSGVYIATSRLMNTDYYSVRKWLTGESTNWMNQANLHYGSYVRCMKATTVDAVAMNAENVTSTSADLFGRVGHWPAGGQAEEVWMTWSTSDSFDPNVAPVNVECVEYTGDIWPVGGYNLDIVKVSLTDLQPNTTYHYRVHAVNVAGEKVSFIGNFTTAE